MDAAARVTKVTPSALALTLRIVRTTLSFAKRIHAGFKKAAIGLFLNSVGVKPSAVGYSLPCNVLGDLAGEVIPAMPVTANLGQNEHRDRDCGPPEGENLHFSCVARPVDRAERRTVKAAQDAVDDEWRKLRDVPCWDEKGVREANDVVREAKRDGKTVHFGRIFDMCVQKGSELPDGHKGKKYKGRSVYQGNQVKDQNQDYAIFNDISSSPNTMEGGKAIDAHGSIAGNSVEQSDARQAYPQTTLKGKIKNSVRLPKDQWPKAWIDAGLIDPVCPLTRALYGHPESGGWYEPHCEDAASITPVCCSIRALFGQSESNGYESDVSTDSGASGGQSEDDDAVGNQGAG